VQEVLRVEAVTVTIVSDLQANAVTDSVIAPAKRPMR
jgi:hypothetical protein